MIEIEGILIETIFEQTELEQLLNISPLFDPYIHYKSAYSAFSDYDRLTKYSLADLVVWQNMGLYQGDALGMGNSLEIRMPFMDHKQ